MQLCVRTMVRIAVVFICSVLISGPAAALPRQAVPGELSAVIRVEEPSGLAALGFAPHATSSRALPENCRNPQDRPDRCAASLARGQEQNRQRHEKQSGSPAKEEQGMSRLAAAKPARLLSEHERNAIAPRPMTPPGAGTVKAAVPGKTVEERLRHMVGQLLLTGFSGRQLGDPDVERIAGDLRGGKLAGVLVRDSNIENAAQLRELLAGIGGAAGEDTPLILIEQAGGPELRAVGGEGLCLS